MSTNGEWVSLNPDFDQKFSALESKLDEILAILNKPKRQLKAPAEGYDNKFEYIWNIYPKRMGSNPKNMAYRAYKARIAEKHTPETIYQGVCRYLAFCKATGIHNTDYVMQGSTFFGPRKEFLTPWSLPTPETSAPKTAKDWIAKGEALGIIARPGEEMSTYIDRIRGSMR